MSSSTVSSFNPIKMESNGLFLGSDQEKILKKLLTAVESNDEQSVQAILQLLPEKNIPAFLQAFDSQGKNVLQTAVKNKNVNILQVMLGFASDADKKICLDIRYQDNNTLLLLSVLNYDRAMVSFLLENGANFYAQDEDDCTLLINVITREKNNNIEILELLIEGGVKINVLNKSGKMPLTLTLETAVSYKQKSLDCLRLAEILDDFAVDIKLSKCLDRKKELLEKYSDDKNLLEGWFDDLEFSTHTNINESARNYALQKVKEYNDMHLKYLEVVKILIKNGADINMKNFYGSPPLMSIFSELSIKKRNVDLVELLVMFGADCNATDDNGLTFFMYLAGNNYSSATKDEDLVYISKLVEILLNGGADINRVDNVDLTALDYAILANSPEIASLLKENNATSANPSFTKEMKSTMEGDERALISAKPKALFVFPNYQRMFESAAFRKYFTIHLAVFFAKKYSLTVRQISSFEDFNKFLSNQYDLFYTTCHGKKDEMVFCDSFSLHKNQVKQLDFSNLNPTALFIIEACVTGAKKGIAQKIAKCSQRTVIAPTKPSTAGLSKYHFTDNRQQLDVKFVLEDLGKIEDITRFIEPKI